MRESALPDAICYAGDHGDRHDAGNDASVAGAGAPPQSRLSPKAKIHQTDSFRTKADAQISSVIPAGAEESMRTKD